MLACVSGCAPTASVPTDGVDAPLLAPPLVQRPTGCIDVSADQALQSVIDAAEPGAVYCLAAGRYTGPFRIDKGITLWGPREAHVVSRGEGTTIEISGSGATLLGLTVDGSGGRFDMLDAAVHVVGDDVTVQGVDVKNATFGLLVEKSNRARIVGNRVVGPDSGPLGLRGDGIRFWETRDSQIVGNQMTGCRDMVVWYSSGNQIIDNVVSRSRYGTHFMYSHGNRVQGNRYIDNVVGMFVMYSRNIDIHDNMFARSAGAAGMGLGIKESGNLDTVDNVFVANRVGVYVDTAPLQKDHYNTFRNNGFYFSEVGVLLHGSESRNTFERNTFANNHVQVDVEGGGTALDIKWHENAFDDYAGYDLDTDGYGDIPYELRSLSVQLKSSYPQLGFFRGTAALDLLDAVSSLFPMVEPKTTLVDAHPAMNPRVWAGGDAH